MMAFCVVVPTGSIEGEQLPQMFPGLCKVESVSYGVMLIGLIEGE